MLQRPFVGNKVSFTIVEMMAVVVITALLIVSAIPGYENFVRNNEAFITASRLADSFRLAKSEAIKNGIPVSVCPIGSSFNPTGAFTESSEQYPCVNTTTWDAWKVFKDANNNGTENFSDGWPVIKYYGDVDPGTITSNISGRITFDPMGFANINPTATRTGWTWSSSYSSGAWTWSYTYSSAYSGSYYRLFTVSPSGCTGQNAKAVEITQNGIITITNIDCYGA